SDFGIKHTSISSSAVAVRFTDSSLMSERCPRSSPLVMGFTIWLLPLSVSLDILQLPDLIQNTAFAYCPSSERFSPFVTRDELLQLATLRSSSLLKAFRELNCLTIYCANCPMFFRFDSNNSKGSGFNDIYLFFFLFSIRFLNR